MPAVDLICHPRSPTDAVRGIRARASRATAALLHLTFVLDGDIARLRVPPFREPLPGSDLWRNTCFEAFVKAEGSSAYHELNLSPSGEWAVLAFRGYREREPPAAGRLRAADPPSPRITVRTTPERLELDALVPIDHLAAAYARAPLRLALAVVVEEANGACSYWSLRHMPGDPDFHHPEGFVLRLEPSADAC